MHGRAVDEDDVYKIAPFHRSTSCEQSGRSVRDGWSKLSVPV